MCEMGEGEIGKERGSERKGEEDGSMKSSWGWEETERKGRKTRGRRGRGRKGGENSKSMLVQHYMYQLHSVGSSHPHTWSES